eukprot:6462942-Amphidinium_carterae.1
MSIGPSSVFCVTAVQKSFCHDGTQSLQGATRKKLSNTTQRTSLNAFVLSVDQECKRKAWPTRL